MHKGKRGVLFVFSGPSGVGKGTLKAKLFEEFADQIAYSVSATTRGPREGEVDGKDYFFISRQEFERRVKNNEFLEHAEFAGNCYGTPRAYVEKLLDSGMNVVLEIDVQGALQVMKSMPECVSVFILPPSFEELEHRLRGRGTETEEKVRERLETAKRELPYAPQYDYQIVNGGDIEAAYQSLRDVFLKSTGEA
ncbi:MAG: guanylate kinase [Christensenellales bacterium]|nr:guanylate kinase [Christensenellales bacterium]